jgi:5-methylcytosine-specific restriction endonuclease McrA
MAGQFREQVVKRLTRSNGWAKVRAARIDLIGHCECCGKSPSMLKRFRLQVHHIKPFHVWPELELDPENLIVLCSNPSCHLDKGHLGDFRSWNESVRRDCAAWLQKYKWRPR